MDENIIILRPIQTIYNEFYLSDNSREPHDLINEIVSDTDSTYIEGSHSDGYGSTGQGYDTQYASFLFGGNAPDFKIRVNSLKIFLSAWLDLSQGVGEFFGSIKIGDNTTPSYSFGSPESWSLVSIVFDSSSDLIAWINSAINKDGYFPEIIVELSAYLNPKSDTKDVQTVEGRISQAYIELVYENNIGVFEKINGTYKAATVAYKKHGGIWNEITEDECKEMLKNNNIRRG